MPTYDNSSRNSRGFNVGKNWILKLKPQKIVKGVIEIKITNIYYLTPDYELAGKNIGD